MFQFESQPCTTIEQSQWLLALGLKKSTADMFYDFDDKDGPTAYVLHADVSNGWDDDYLPAWSLHRLMMMMPTFVENKEGHLTCKYSRYSVFVANHITKEDLAFDDSKNLFDNIINCIDWMIDNQYFPSDFLRPRKTVLACRSTGKSVESLIDKKGYKFNEL